MYFVDNIKRNLFKYFNCRYIECFFCKKPFNTNSKDNFYCCDGKFFFQQQTKWNYSKIEVIFHKYAIRIKLVNNKADFIYCNYYLHDWFLPFKYYKLIELDNVFSFNVDNLNNDYQSSIERFEKWQVFC